VVLLFAIAAALETDAERGALAGFASGLAFDLLLDTPTGLSALTGALVGWGVGSAKETVLRDATVIWIGLVALASALGTLLYAGLAVVLGVTVDAAALPAIVGVIAAVNVASSKPMRWALRWAYGPESRARDRGPSVFR
jgi:rod shape-determining protein MreD